MLTALPALPIQLKSDPAPTSTHRPPATITGDNSFASLIRRQADQRLDALRLADQQALAARVSAAAATPMPRPVADHLASRPPMPGQTAAQPNPPKTVAPTAAAPAPSTAQGNAAQASPTPTRPTQASTSPARAKAAGTAGRPEPARSLPAHSGVADDPAASRASRERKPGAAPGTDAAAEDTTSANATQPLPPGDATPTGIGLPTDLAALQALQVITGPGLPDGPVEARSEGLATAGLQTQGDQRRITPNTAKFDESKRPAMTQPPAPGLADDLAPAIDDPASPGAPQARIGRATSLHVDPKGLGLDGRAAAPRDLARTVDPASEPASDEAAAQRHRGPTRPETLPAAQRDELAAAALPGDWRPGTVPAADNQTPAAPAETQAASRHAGPGTDSTGPGPAASPSGPAAARPGSAAPAGIDGPGAAAVLAAAPQPGTAAPGFDSALQAVLAQGVAPSGAATAARQGAEAPLALQIDAPVDSPLFAPALGSQLSLLARDGVRSALLQLHPAEMGPISVEIALDGNAARIDFQALRADTRGLIEASLPALAGALQDAGMTLAGGGVFEQAPGRQPQAQAEPGPGARQPGQADKGSGGPQEAPQPTRRAAPRGLVDLVA